MVHLVTVNESINVSARARVFIDKVFRLHGLPRALVFDRDPRFTAGLRRSVFKKVEARLKTETFNHFEEMARQN